MVKRMQWLKLNERKSQRRILSRHAPESGPCRPTSEATRLNGPSLSSGSLDFYWSKDPFPRAAHASTN